MRYSIRLLCLFLCLSPHFCSGQPDTIYINADWKETDKAHATYYRLSAKLGPDKYVVEDHYIDGNIQMVGHYSRPVRLNDDSTGNSARNGTFVFYENHSLTKTSEGIISEGKHEGKWRDYFVNSNTVKSEYNYKDGLEDGPMVAYDSLTHRVTMTGNYEEGVKTGKWKSYYSYSGKLAKKFIFGNEGTATAKYFYESGELWAEGALNSSLGKEGEWTYYNKYGFVIKTETYMHDTLNGPMRKYRVSFTLNRTYSNCLWQEYNYNMGKISDTAKMYDINTGKLKYSLEVNDNRPDGQFTAYAHGHVVTTGQLNDSIKNGLWKEYYPGTDQIFREANYKNGKFDGSVITYFENGQKKKEEQYRDGWQSGIQKTYYKNGMLKSAETWDYNVPDGPASYYDSTSGQKTKDLTYFTDQTNLVQLNGYCANYYEPGSIKTEGTFIYGEKNGEWKFYDENGRLTSIKYFEKGLLSGPFLQYYPATAKKAVEGNYKDHKREGVFRYYFPNSDSLSGVEYYKNDSADGHFVYYSKPGVVKTTGDYASGRMTGEWRVYYNNGKIRSVENYLNDKKQGPAKYFDSITGYVLQAGQYANDGPDGEWTFFGEDTHQKAAVMHFANGMADGSINAYDKNGRLVFKGNFSEGQKNGQWITYYSGSNHIWTQTNFRKDTMTGESKILYESGKKMITQTYDDTGLKSSEKYYNENGRELEEPDLNMRLAIDKREKEMQAYMTKFPIKD